MNRGQSFTPIHVRLLYLLLVGNVMLRFLTNLYNVLPRALNLLDVGLTAAIGIIFIFSRRTKLPGQGHPLFQGRRLVAFNIVLLSGALLNAGAMYFPAAIAQCVMLNEPLLLFIALVNLPFDVPQIQTFIKILRGLIIVELLLGILQFPIFLSTGDSEAIVGTFAGNAEQYTGFLLLGVCFFVGAIKVEPAKKVRYSMLVVTLMTIIPLVDNKASWLGVITASYMLMSSLGSFNAGRLKYIAVFVVLAGIFLIVAMRSATLYKFDALSNAWQSGNILNLGKVKAYLDISSAFLNQPHMLLVGSGPGTFYSRASQQFYLLSPDMFSNPAQYIQGRAMRKSNSMGGIVDPTTTVEPFYRQFSLSNKIFSVGSGQVDSLFASYAGLLGETGLIGLFLYMTFYRKAFRWIRRCCSELRHDATIFPLVTASFGLLVYTLTVSIYNPWLETGRVTTILWSMLAMVYQYTVLRQDENRQAPGASRLQFVPPQVAQ